MLYLVEIHRASLVCWRRETKFRIYLLVNCFLTVYPKKYAHGFCFAVLCCGYTLTYLPISIRLTSLALWQSNDCPSASKATLMNMDRYFMWIHCERLHNHNKSTHNKTMCIFIGIYCMSNIGAAEKKSNLMDRWTCRIHYELRKVWSCKWAIASNGSAYICGFWI